MSGTIQSDTVKLPEHPGVVRMHLHIELTADRPCGQIDEMPLPPVGGCVIPEIAIAVDGNAIQKDLHRLIRRGEEKALIRPRIRRNIDANPYMMRSLGHSDAELRIELSPTPLIL